MAIAIRKPTSLGEIINWSEALTGAAIAAGIAIAVALALHTLIFTLLGRLTRLSKSTSDEIILQRLRGPTRWLMAAISVSIAEENNAVLKLLWDEVSRFVVPGLLGWLAFAGVGAFARAMDARAQEDTNLATSRSRRTRIAIVARALRFVVVLLTVGLMLFAVPGVKAIGASLLASAGLVGLAVGAAAQPALRSLVAGIQIALTEPIRIGDFVVVENESGRVEDIRLSYVVVRTGDERRVIVPTAKFLDASFQNWTRVGGGITGSVNLPVKPDADIDAIRAEFLRLIATCPEWDQRSASLQVAEARVGSIDLKLVMSAKGPTSLGTLRLAVREAMLAWLRKEMPDALCNDA